MCIQNTRAGYYMNIQDSVLTNHTLAHNENIQLEMILFQKDQNSLCFILLRSSQRHPTARRT